MLGKILQSVRKRRHGRHRAPQVQHAAIANAPPGQSVEPRNEPSASGDPKAADYDLPLESQQHSRTNAIGLKVVFVPEVEHTADIVFVHGLGGTSQGTWTKNKDPKLFWPSTFLPNEPGFKGARILTFGYEATFRKYTEHAKILYDFGQDLLYDLKHGKDYNGDSLNIGSVPLLFVAHSMGGLLVREAYLSGQVIPQYAPIIRAVAAIVFLATPHRGTNLAQTLNRILQLSVISNSKQFILELVKNSHTLHKLNDQFRHVAPQLEIVSFYESQPTAVGAGLKTQIMIVEKDSAVLGYPGERSHAMNANHQTICKYDNPQDPNYLILKVIFESMLKNSLSKNATENFKPLRETKRILAIDELPTADYVVVRDQWSQGTCNWILNTPEYTFWRTGDDASLRLLWINGNPGVGKSVLSSFIINDMVEGGIDSQYFYVKFGDSKKTSLAYLLRSLAYQIALRQPEVRQRLLLLGEKETHLDNSDTAYIWKNIFKSIIFAEKRETPFFWVIDGLDEADAPERLISLCHDVPAGTRLRIAITSRRLPGIVLEVDELSRSHSVGIVDMNQQRENLGNYVEQQLRMDGSTEYKSSIARRIVDDAGNNFLWARLAAEAVNNSLSADEIKNALQRLPSSMEALYDRMARKLMNSRSHSRNRLAASILRTACFCKRGLTLQAFQDAVGESMSTLINPERAIVELSGGFVIVDNDNRVSLSHHSVREYFTSVSRLSLGIRPDLGHSELFKRCLQTLVQLDRKVQHRHNDLSEFTTYAAEMWPAHMACLPTVDKEASILLFEFLTCESVLSWVFLLAMQSKLEVLLQTSRLLLGYIKNVSDSIQNFEFIDSASDSVLLESWAMSLSKLVGSFGRSLRHKPDAIFDLVPPLCPLNSIMYKQFARIGEDNLVVVRNPPDNWDDGLPRVSFGPDQQVSSISVAASWLGALDNRVTRGTISLYDTEVLMNGPVETITHGEYVDLFTFNADGTLVATYGIKTTKIWALPTGECIFTTPSPRSQPRPNTLQFNRDGSKLFVGSEDLWIRCVDLADPASTWRGEAYLDEPEIDGHVLNGSNYMAIDESCRLVAVGFRGHPLSAWELHGPTHVGHCWRSYDSQARGEVICASWIPGSTVLLGIYLGGDVFKWNPYKGLPEELPTLASTMAVSSDGRLMCTGDPCGNIKIFSVEDLSLIYHRVSPEMVYCLAFSPNGTQIYDSRGHFGNVWAPDILLKYATGLAKPQRSDNVLLSKHPVRYALSPIVALAVSPRGLLYASGNSDGKVRIERLRELRGDTLLSLDDLPDARMLSWGVDGKTLYRLDFSPTLTVTVLGSEGDSEPSPLNSTEIRLDTYPIGGSERLVVCEDAGWMLLQSESSLGCISLADARIQKWRELSGIPERWIVHPHDSSHILRITHDTICLFDWELQEKWRARMEIKKQLERIKSSATDWAESLFDVLISPDDKFLILDIRQTSKRTIIAQVSTTLLHSIERCMDKEITISPVILDDDISSSVSRCLTLLQHQRLVFLSYEHSLCSLTLPWGGIKEHIVLPSDWVSPDAVELCSYWREERCLLWPNFDSVIAIKCMNLG